MEKNVGSSSLILLIIGTCASGSHDDGIVGVVYHGILSGDVVLGRLGIALAGDCEAKVANLRRILRTLQQIGSARHSSHTSWNSGRFKIYLGMLH